jgi:hypothetical protein
VPKEVGKVGTESATFIEPIENRKDGIQAMFSKQKQAQQTPVKPKRKRSTSPSPVPDATSSRAFAVTKKPKLEKKVESDDEAQVVGNLPAPNIIKLETVCSTASLQNASHLVFLTVHSVQKSRWPFKTKGGGISTPSTFILSDFLFYSQTSPSRKMKVWVFTAYRIHQP